MSDRRRKEEEEESEENDPKKQRISETEEVEEEEESDDENQRNALLQQMFNTIFMASRRTGDSNDALIDSLKQRDVLSDPIVEDAFRTIPRGEFVPEDLKDEAYHDSPLRLGALGFNISAPHMYAICLENLNLQKGNSFLDIGSGCGLFTCLAAYLVGKDGISHGIDLRKDIIEFSRNNVANFSQKTGIDFKNVQFFVRNCFLPTADEKTYDRIHVGACCPTALLEQLLKLLTPGGVLVTPLEDKLVRITKDLQGNPKTKSLMGVRYSDLIIPSEAEIKEAVQQIEYEKETRIIVPENNFIQDFAKLCNTSELSDVTLVVEGKEIPAHKIILAARSSHFKAMFFSGMKESSQSKVTLQDMSYEPFLDVLAYVYSGNINIQNADHAIELLEVANYLKLDRLKSLCEVEIRKGIDIENAAYILQISSQYEAWQLKSFAMRFIIDHYSKVENTKCFDDLPKNLMKEVLSVACKKT